MAKIDPSRSIPTRASEAQSWIQWHKDLKKALGKKSANSIWVYAWQKRGGIDAPANTNSLREYMSSQGVDIEKTSMAALTDFGEDIVSGFGNLLSAGKWVFIGVSVLAMIVILRIVFKLTQDGGKGVASTVVSARTGGLGKLK